jgi:hypothetical protein
MAGSGFFSPQGRRSVSEFFHPTQNLLFVETLMSGKPDNFTREPAADFQGWSEKNCAAFHV